MFDSIGWGEVLVIIVAGLFILGPERLPGAARWLGQTVHKLRTYATGARDQLQNELGPEFEELRKPLEDLRSLRSLNPRTAITQHLLDGYDPVEDLRQFDVREDFNLSGQPVKPNGFSASTPNGAPVGRQDPGWRPSPVPRPAPEPQPAVQPTQPARPVRTSSWSTPTTPDASTLQQALQMNPLLPGESAPFDPDAT